jgi:copper chaperone CopZ
MKTLELAIIILTAIFFTVNSLPAFAGDEETIVNTPTIVCNMCKKNVNSALKKLDGVENVSVDLKEKKVSNTMIKRTLKL